MAAVLSLFESLCSSCGEEEEHHLQILIHSIHSEIDYTVPSFPVFTVRLLEIKFQFLSDENDNIILDGYGHISLQELHLPVLLNVCSGNQSGFLVDSDEFQRSGVSLAEKTLYEEDKVFILWKWKYNVKGSGIEDMYSQDLFATSPSQTDTSEDENTDANVTHTSSEIASNMSQNDCNEVIHAVVFKCVGCNKSKDIQAVLAEAAMKIENSETVLVRLTPEPNNPFDSEAIQFQCFIKEQWKTVGYVVREALNAVHESLEHKKIKSVSFAWIKYITHWNRSGPGWYCGIEIQKCGRLWPKNVVQCRSTI